MLFREEAIERYRRSSPDDSLLALDDRWSGIAYWLLCAVFAALMTGAAVIPLHRYASGPAVVRARGHFEITASESGTLTSIFVAPGQLVRQGDTLVELDDKTQAFEHQRAVDETSRMQARLLRDPADEGARADLPRLRAERDLAQKRFAARRILAPRDGRIQDLHLRIGQRIQVGDVVASIAEADAFVVVALLPGYARPTVIPGSTVRIEFEGYRSSYLELRVDSAASEVVGPEVARRELGVQVADALTLAGPLALVKASLAGTSFLHDHQVYNLYDGMRATAEVRTHSERALLVLIPGLREVRRRVFGR